MKKIFKSVGLICVVLLLTMSASFAAATTESVHNHNFEDTNDNNLLLFVPSDTTSEELEIIHNSNIQEFPDREIIIIKESPDIEWTDKVYQTISLNSDSFEKTTLNIEEEKMQVADTASIKELLESNELKLDQHTPEQSVAFFCITHKWNETLVGSPYKRYSKNINSWCYRMYQDVVRICKACDTTDEKRITVATHYHDWRYTDRLGNRYNYQCDNCGMAKK